MRYHWSQGVGHTYSHGTNFEVQPESTLAHADQHETNDDDDNQIQSQHPPVGDGDKDDPDPDDPELAMEERENEDLGPEPDELDGGDPAFQAEPDDDNEFSMYYM